jgi:hypothetical protein
MLGDVPHLSTRIVELLRGIHDKVDALPFLCVRRMLGEKKSALSTPGELHTRAAHRKFARPLTSG